MNSNKSLWNGILTAVIGIVVILAVAVGGVRLVGLTPFAVLSGSMEPSYPVGSLIYVRKTDCGELRSGDVITFVLSDGTAVTHRIVEVIPDGSDPSAVSFRTKGDSNSHVDAGTVSSRNVIGKAVFTVPYLGYVSSFVTTPPGVYFTVAAGALLLMVTILTDSSRGGNGRNENKRDQY